MSESPPEPPPILLYAAPRLRPKLRVPGYLEVILYLWAVFTVLYGALLGYVCLAALPHSNMSRDQIYLWLIPWPILILWGVAMFVLAVLIALDRIAALRGAVGMMIVQEIFMWVLIGILFVVGMVDGEILIALFFLLMFFVPPAAAACWIRIQLRRALKLTQA
ncbi:MAG: hypothetical protein FWD61_05065 [Phycisphaerales bacterium]|nr:hypothetical protein [Phycisphaerales bacterium]